MAARKSTETTETASNRPARSGSASGIPGRVGRPRNNYDAWLPEIEDLRANLGQAYSYEGTEKCQTVVQGLRRTYGVRAAARDMDKETGVGTLWIEYPSVDNGDGTFSEDEETVKSILAKYAK